MAFNIRTSKHGRQMAISSSGGWVSAFNSTGRMSTAVELAAQMWGPAMHNNVSSTVASTIGNVGITTMTSGSATAITGFEIIAPVQGGYKEIHIDTSASEISFGGTSTAIIFASTIVTANGSTMFVSAANAAGTVITLRGMSTAQWAIIGSTTNLAIG